VELTFRGEIVYWRGPSPFHFVALPEDEAAEVATLAPALTYGWGVVPASGRVGGTDFTTALFPRDGGYLVPLKTAVRKAEGLELGDDVEIHLTLGR
jgi:hypothetical protein